MNQAWLEKKKKIHVCVLRGLLPRVGTCAARASRQPDDHKDGTRTCTTARRREKERREREREELKFPIMIWVAGAISVLDQELFDKATLQATVVLRLFTVSTCPAMSLVKITLKSS